MNEIVGGSPSKDDSNIAMLAHLLGVFGFIPSLIIWLVKKDQSAFIAQEAKEALNFQITMLIGYAICRVLFYVMIGFPLLGVLVIINIVLCIMGAVAVSKGQGYRYPFALRLIN